MTPDACLPLPSSSFSSLSSSSLCSCHVGPVLLLRHILLGLGGMGWGELLLRRSSSLKKAHSLLAGIMYT
ncbi:hypothetical protein E2C01_076648 [Portunus trituberculatus]|uniref:Uncharacterized protein n=1 Tax=Portunus trituberculatus TaxID=210409 RepID=A0A5B7IJ97_PORTR|nr:hypothetical protein [Portunus trituberculatus]